MTDGVLQVSGKGSLVKEMKTARLCLLHIWICRPSGITQFPPIRVHSTQMGNHFCSLSRPHQSSLHSDMVTRRLLKVYYGDWLVYDAITLHAVYCIQHGQFCFANRFAQKSQTHFLWILKDVSGHLVGVSEETSFCEVQLNYNAEVHFMVFTLYSTSLLSVHAEVWNCDLLGLVLYRHVLSL
jgi:hypothetical protein